MIELPTWMVGTVGGLVATLLAVIGYLIRSMMTRSDLRLARHSDRLDAVEREQAQVDKKFVEAELKTTEKFVAEEAFTRDYVTLRGQLETLHKRIDDFERKRSMMPRSS